MYVRTEGSSTLVYTMYVYLDNLDLFMFSFFICLN